MEAEQPGKVQETIAALKNAFAEDPPNLTEAKGLSVQLKYWQGLENAAKEWSPQ
jgi:molecular chaperone HscB